MHAFFKKKIKAQTTKYHRTAMHIHKKTHFSFHFHYFTKQYHRTAMHMAAEKGHTSTVEFLADKFRASVFDRTKVKTIKQ